jgi:hypothetical protein
MKSYKSISAHTGHATSVFLHRLRLRLILFVLAYFYQVRLALAFEELGKLRAAQAAVTRALSLPLTPALSKAASACSRRVEAASQADASVLAASSNSGNTLVRGGAREEGGPHKVEADMAHASNYLLCPQDAFSLFIGLYEGPFCRDTVINPSHCRYLSTLLGE